MCLTVVRINTKGASVALLGSRRVSALRQEIAEVVVIRRNAWLEGDRFVDKSNAIGVVPLLSFEHTQQMERIGVPGFPSHDLQIALLRACKVSALVQGKTFGHQVSDGLIE
jgi:hypothetical protein